MYKPTAPSQWEDRIRKATNGKVPYFFKYAKGKLDHQVNPRSDGVVDRLYDLIQIYKFRFNDTALGDFDYRMLMYDENIPYGEKEKKLVAEFRRDSSRMGNINGGGLHDEDSQYWLKIKELRRKTLQYGSVQYVTDVLVRGLFAEHHVRKKAAFWECFGDQIYENLQNNLPAKTRMCARCGKRFRIDRNRQYCEKCEPLPRLLEMRWATCVACGCTFKTRDEASGAICPACKEARTIRQYCVDCGAPFDMYARGRPSIRCSKCQTVRNRSMSRKWKIKYRK